MLIQSIGNSVSVAAPSGRISDDAPKVVIVQTPNITVTPPSPSQLDTAVHGMNQAMQQAHQSLEFSVDSATKTPVVTMKDTVTGQVVGQYPSEAALAIAHAIEQLHPGVLLKLKA
ncbi:MAG: hypothetical protein RL358_649 [Pseudomonadota bacterium]|jgi:uncharacterized FlaG/YvyC family protein